MAGLAGGGIVYRLDTRVKLFCLALLSVSGLSAGPPGLAILSLVAVWAASAAGRDLLSALRDARPFFLLLIAVLLARGLSTPGPAALSAFGLTLTRPGLIDGALVCWRLLLTVVLGLTVMATTRAAEIRAAVVWFLRPVPWIPAARVATMIGLLVRFLPEVLRTARETAAAQRARGIENRKNPVYRLTRLAAPLMRKTFLRADRLALAMTARCYTEDRTGPELRAGRVDRVILLAAVAVCLPVIIA
jgi:energy-coupling factor transporter transmembrane protein EcfT